MDGMSVVPDRLLALDELYLHHGAHDTFEEGHCAVEVVAWLAGEPHTDHPACGSPVIAAFLRRWNDDLDDQGRQQLKKVLPTVVGTAGGRELEERRAWMATDWLVRVHTPAWLDLAGVTESAAALRALPPLAVGFDSQDVITSAREKAHAARDAARAVAGDAAGDAARDAARAAARDAARDAAWDAAGDAAWAVARAAARDALKPTVVALQVSALELIEQMAALR